MSVDYGGDIYAVLDDGLDELVRRRVGQESAALDVVELLADREISVAPAPVHGVPHPVHGGVGPVLPLALHMRPRSVVTLCNRLVRPCRSLNNRL